MDRLIFLALFLAVSGALLAAFRIDKHLSADGVHYFTKVLDSGRFPGADPTRRFAEYLVQWPVVLAVCAGVTQVPTLSAVFALGIYLPYVLSFALCLYAVRRDNAVVLSLPILSIACVNLPGDYILAGQHHVMVLLASPILLMILRRAPPTWCDGLLLGLALLTFTRAYATAFGPALLFSILLAVRLYRDRGHRRTTVIRGLALVLSIATIAVGVLSVVSPRVPANRDLFWQSLSMVFRRPEISLPAAFAVLFLVSLVSRGRLSLILSTVPLVLYVTYVLRADHGLTALQSFGARTLSVTLLTPLLLLTVGVHSRGQKLDGFRRVLLVGMVLAITLNSVGRSTDWARYRNEMKAVLTTERGYVAVEATKLYTNPCRWEWTSPELSVVWSFPVVQAIVENPRHLSWEPFDPRRHQILKRYVQYDVVFAEVSSAEPVPR